MDTSHMVMVWGICTLFISSARSLDCYKCQHYSVSNDDLFKEALEDSNFNSAECELEGDAITKESSLKPISCEAPPEGHTAVCIKVKAHTKGRYHGIHDVELHTMLRGCSYVKQRDLVLDSCQNEGVKVVDGMQQLGWSHDEPTDVIEGRACWCRSNRCNHGNATGQSALLLSAAILLALWLGR